MRQYLIGSWNNADGYDYSGEQLMGNRLGASREVPHFLENGRANVAKYGDNTAKVTKVPLVDRVLPQQRRVRVLTEQLYELEAERKNGLDLTTYSQLRDILICKRDRAEILLKKALSAKPIRLESEEDEEEIYYSSSFIASDNNRHRESYSSPVGGSFFAEVVDGLSETNSLKSFLKMSCKVVRKAVHFKHKAARYLNELKEV